MLSLNRKLMLMMGSASIAIALPGVALAQIADSAADAPAERDNGEIVVVATRAQATDVQLRSDKAISVLSNEDLEHTAVHNVAEALGLMPGVNVMNTGSSFFGGIDGASRGEGMFVSIRGLNAEFNVNLINGVNVAQGMPYSRQVKLSLLPPSGLNTIVLNKVSTADMDGDAIGGTVDFRTPTAFDFNGDLHIGVTASGRLESRARSYDESGIGGGASVEIAKRFGSNGDFGFYASGYYDERHFANSQMGGAMAAQSDGGWGYLTTQRRTNADGSFSYVSHPDLDPEQNITQTGVNIGMSRGYTTRWGGNASFDWHPDDETQLYLRGTYASAKTEQNSTFAQYASNNKSYAETLPGSGRYNLSVDQISTRVWYETNPEKATLATVALGGVKETGGWKISPQIFYSEGHNDRPDHIEASVRNNQSDKFNTGTLQPLGGLSMTYRDNLPQPVFTPGILADLNDAGNRLLARRAGQLTEQFSGQTKWGARLDLERNFEGSVLQSIKFGGKYSDSSREITNRNWTNDHFANLLGRPGVTWNELGIFTGNYDSVFPGVYNFKLGKVDHDKLVEYFYKYQIAASFDTCGGSYEDNYNCNTQRGSERVAAGYVMANIQAGDLELIPGIRYEHTSIDNTYWVRETGKTGRFESNNTQYDQVLPSLLANYRPTPNSVYRGSLWWSYTRPAFVQLGGGSQIDVGDTTTTITVGNPNLKPVKSMNIDLSAEWKIAPGGYLTVGGYYKHLSDYMYDSGSGYQNGTELKDNNIVTVMPQNAGSGDVYGLEMQFRKKFVEAPGILGGFGIGGSLTRQWTKVDIGGGVQRRIQNAPEIMGDAQLFWEQGRFSVDMIYHYTGEYVSNYSALGLRSWDDLWVRPIQTVDIHAGLDLGGGVRVDASVANLFGNYTYWSHIGRNSLALSDVVDSGATSLITLKAKF